MADDDKDKKENEATEAKKEDSKDEKSPASEDGGASSGKSSKKVLLLSVVAGLLVVGLSVTTTLLLVGGSNSPEPQANAEQAEGEGEDVAANEEEEEVADAGEGADAEAGGEPHFYKFLPAFVVNIPSEGRIRFLQIEVEVMSRSEDVIEDVEAYAPLLKNELVTLFSSQRYEEVVTAQGRDALRTEALKRVQKIMTEQAGVDGVEQVLFTSFVTQ